MAARPGLRGRATEPGQPEPGRPEPKAFDSALKLARGVRWWIGSVMGDDAYARYLDHLARRHPGCPVPTEKEFWRERYAAMDAVPGERCC